jgi:hypothetical protein
MSERIGEFLLRVGAMSPEQIEQVLHAQKSGDARLFGEIALELGYIRDDAVKRYLEYLEKQAEG